MREHDLSPMSRSHDARCSVHIETDVCPIDQPWVAGVQAHADADLVAVGPGMFCKCSLCLCGGGGGIICRAKDDEECVAFGIHLVAVMRVERSSQHAAMGREQLWVKLPRTLEQLRRALDIGEEQGDGAARSFDHLGPTIARNEPNWKPRLWTNLERSEIVSFCDAGGDGQ